MVCYIEYVLLDNFFIDYMLLNATFTLTEKKADKCRLFVCSLLGAVIALILPLLNLNNLFSGLIKLFIGLILVSLCQKGKGAKRLYKNYLVFLFLTALTGGGVMAIFYLFSIPYSTEISIFIMFLPVYLLLSALKKVLKYILKKNKEKAFLFKIKLFYGNTALDGVGFMDTGNALYDGENPVIVCDKSFALKLINNDIAKTKFRKITVRTISEKRENYAFTLTKLLIYKSGVPNIYNNVTVCISNCGVGEGYDVILHPALMEVNDDRTSLFEIEEVS